MSKFQSLNVIGYLHGQWIDGDQLSVRRTISFDSKSLGRHSVLIKVEKEVSINELGNLWKFFKTLTKV